MAEHPMDEIPVRQLRFDFNVVEDRNPVWSRSSPEFAMFINSLGIHVPHFERFLVKVMRAYRDDLQDDELRADVKAIIGQEAHHAFNFVRWTEKLAERYPGVAALDEHAKEYFEGAFKKRSRKFQVGFTAGYETFTFLGGMIILNRYRELMADADPVIRALWVWHQVEEVEHGAVAFDFNKALYPDAEWFRRWMVVRAFGHITWETFKAYRLMVSREGYYRSLPQAFKAWRFFLSFGFDLGWAALPVLSRHYHPRNHPICNEKQNVVAIAWRKFYQAGNDTHRLNNETIENMLAAVN